MPVHKQSSSVPSTPAYQSKVHFNSATTTRAKQLPVTPQRAQKQRQNQNTTSPMTSNSAYSTPSVSSNGSTLYTPGSNSSMKLGRPQFHSISMVDPREKSFADLAESWRSRASEHGIKVSSARDEFHFADDEASEQNISETHSSDEVSEQPVSHRRVRAQSSVTLTRPLAPLSPVTQRGTALRTYSNAALNTPPRKAALAQQIKLKGSLTDPAQTRRRSFGYPNRDLFDIEEDNYAPYPQSYSFSSATEPIGLPINFQDPFSVSVPSIKRTTYDDEFESFDAFDPPSLTPLQSFEPLPSRPQTPPQSDHLSCSVCGRSAGNIAILEPCSHPLCSACLTSALNIVGEKDMECAVCKKGVDNFQIKRAPSQPKDEKSHTPEALLPSEFEGGGGREGFFDGLRAASTPVPPADGANNTPKAGEPVVLRIDNVPWDITPPVIVAWLRQPVVRVHVLLDRKGKTLSHAFVEFADESTAKAALRGVQNSVLGKGRRARGVTVTRSSIEEVMRSLFPSWKGKFDGTRPSLTGLDNMAMIEALEGGLLLEEEVAALVHLVRSPDSHFLKVPSLPFHYLTSLLSLFPSDVDSRVFWSSKLRDSMFDLAFAAVQILLSKKEGPDMELLTGLVYASMECKAFSRAQIKRLSQLLEVSHLTYSGPASSNCSSPTPSPMEMPQMSSTPPPSHPPAYAQRMRTASHYSNPGYESYEFPSYPLPPPGLTMGMGGYYAPQQPHIHFPQPQPQPSLTSIAMEFGVEPHLVQALMQRLSGMTVC